MPPWLHTALEGLLGSLESAVASFDREVSRHGSLETQDRQVRSVVGQVDSTRQLCKEIDRLLR